ncbi:uncharacterized protein LOC127812530 [Diospyros lotus]|uniref:uncharacterized protein LOC127812530 n=1 Tax=Diospyros lotus TaxID=55363 RepID=UPI00224D79DA|nr:uncharacterized protein LOC127812530 [Diospyros lotus]
MNGRPIDRPKLLGHNYELMLGESITHFLAEYSKGSTDFSELSSIFCRLVQTMDDPPLEITWFYAAVTFHSSAKLIAEEPSKKVARMLWAAKDLFHLLVSCSSPAVSRLKSVALLAPAVYRLYDIVVYCSKNGLCLNREIDGLVERICSYISMCCSNCFEGPKDGADGLTAGFADLVRVWTVDGVGERCESGDDLRVFFPLVSGQLCSGLRGGCGIGYIAGIVMIEAFLLRLCLNFGSSISRTELKKDMQHWAVQTIAGFQSCYFFDMLLRILMEPSLPVTTLVSSEDEVLLQEVLYDGIILVQDPFLKSQVWPALPSDYLKNFALMWLLVADKAVQFARVRGDQNRAISYIDAFSRSSLPNQLIKWIMNQTHLAEKISGPTISTPKALIRWLLILADRGVRVFDNESLQLYAKEVTWKSKTGHEKLKSKPDSGKTNCSFFFFTENNWMAQNEAEEDQEMVDWFNDPFLPTGCAGHPTDDGKSRKRQEGRPDEGEVRYKLAKFDPGDNSVGDTCLPHRDDNFNCRDEIKLQSMV